MNTNQVTPRTAARRELACAIALSEYADDHDGFALGDVPDLLQALPLDRITRQRVACLAAGWGVQALQDAYWTH